jgi:HK97 gp10 family phage protein
MIKVGVERRKIVNLATINIPKALEGIIKYVALDIESNAKILAPIDTGNLRNSIKTTQLGINSYRVSTNVHYAIHQEYGTYKMKAHPFMRPAVHIVGVKILSIAKSQLNF